MAREKLARRPSTGPRVVFRFSNKCETSISSLNIRESTSWSSMSWIQQLLSVQFLPEESVVKRSSEHPEWYPPNQFWRFQLGHVWGYSFVIMWIYFVPVPLVYYHVWVLLLWLRLGFGFSLFVCSSFPVFVGSLPGFDQWCAYYVANLMEG